MDRRRPADRNRAGVINVSHQHVGLIQRIDNTGVPQIILRLLVGGFLLYMAIMKLHDPIEFLKLTNQYGVLPTDPPILLNLTAVIMPWLEVVCAVALILGLMMRGASLLVIGMMLFFTPLLIWHAWGLYTAPGAEYASFCDVCFDCGCGTGVVCICWKVTENVGFIIGALLLLLTRSRFLCLSRLFAHCRRTEASAASAPAP
jgi:uncharacterized membrane protein YphA (DoxX/SURF4 family)